MKPINLPGAGTTGPSALKNEPPGDRMFLGASGAGAILRGVTLDPAPLLSGAEKRCLNVLQTEPAG